MLLMECDDDDDYDDDQYAISHGFECLKWTEQQHNLWQESLR